jgi:predicted dithiol-disulfide oxidoreductase (DUF899 family)
MTERDVDDRALGDSTAQADGFGDGVTLWPRGASRRYVTARLELARAERELRDRIEQVAAARRRMPEGAVLPDYAFTEGLPDLSRGDGVRRTRLTELFGSHRSLFVYHLMFHPDDDEACPMCSMWVDGFHGTLHHLERHTAVAVVAKAPLPKLRAWGQRRGWKGLRLLSSHGTTFNADVSAERPDGAQRPMASVFIRTPGGQVRHFYTLPADFPDGSDRGMDLLSPVWNVLDLLPTGRGDWYPSNSDDGASPASTDPGSLA